MLLLGELEDIAKPGEVKNTATSANAACRCVVRNTLYARNAISRVSFRCWGIHRADATCRCAAGPNTTDAAGAALTGTGDIEEAIGQAIWKIEQVLEE